MQIDATEIEDGRRASSLNMMFARNEPGHSVEMWTIEDHLKRMKIFRNRGLHETKHAVNLI
jgi:hypothetical protein